MTAGGRLGGEEAKRILRDLPVENAFYFYRAIDQPILLHSRNLGDFIALVKMVERGSLEFHLKRKDFQNWVAMLGDQVLLDRIDRIGAEGLTGEALRARLLRVVRSRMLQLAKARARKV